jgi:CHAD domain-containing protein
MSTTTGAKSTQPYPEHDKLGPLGLKISVVDDPTALRNALVRAFEAAAHGARDAVAAVEHHAPGAVHEARKSLRRARAVLELVSDALAKAEYRALKTALQDARRALSTVRDHAVAPEMLAQLVLDDADRTTANQVLANAAAALPATAEIRQLLAESAARAAAQAEALQAALPQDVDWDVVAHGLRATYRQARRASRAAKRSKAWFHTWRRRSKELVYQLELIAGHAGARTGQIHSELAGLSDALGPAVDLIMVREFAATYDQGIAAEAVARLREAIDRQLGDLMKAARKTAREAFRIKPKRLAKRVTKAVHRDLAPVADPSDDATSHDPAAS